MRGRHCSRRHSTSTALSRLINGKGQMLCFCCSAAAEALSFDIKVNRRLRFRLRIAPAAGEEACLAHHGTTPLRQEAEHFNRLGWFIAPSPPLRQRRDPLIAFSLPLLQDW